MASKIQPRKWFTRLVEFYDPAAFATQGCVLALDGHVDDLIYLSESQPGVTLAQFLLAQFRDSIDAFASYRYAGKNGNLQYEFNNILNAASAATPAPAQPAAPVASDVLADLQSGVQEDEQAWSQGNPSRSNRVCNPQEAIREIHDLLESKKGRAVVVFEDVFWQIEENDVLGLLMEWPHLCRTNHHLVVFALRREEMQWVNGCFNPKTKGVRALTVDGPTPAEVKALLIRSYLLQGKEFFDWELLDDIAARLAKNHATPGEGYSALFTELIPNTLRAGGMMNVDWVKTLEKPGQKAQEVKLDDLVLKPVEREYFEYLLNAWKNPDWKRAAEERLGKLDIPNRILLYGPPGTGKTTIAKMIATETGRNFFSVTAADFTSEYRGGPLKNVQRHFENWRANKPCVVFWDEVESTAANREGQQHSDNPINQILTELEGTGGRDEDVIIVCATNLYEKLDPAFRRRFPEQLLIGYPDQAGREHLVEKYFNSPAPLLEPALAISDVAQAFADRSPSDIENCAKTCKTTLARRDQQHITRPMVGRWLADHPLDQPTVQYWKTKVAEYEKKLAAFGGG